MVIVSRDNATVKLFSKLRLKKYRDETGKYLIEGLRAVSDSISFLPKGYMLLLSESAFEKYGNDFSKHEYSVCSDKIMSEISETESSQGILCIADKNTSPLNYSNKYALYLDRIRDPGNMGTIIRTALATGFKDIYCFDCVDPYNPKAVRSAMSAVSRINIFYADDTTINDLRKNNYTVFCADMDGKNVFCGVKEYEKACLVIGNEANGLETSIITMCDEVLALPMEDGESLNAGISAAVLMYQLRFAEKL